MSNRNYSPEFRKFCVRAMKDTDGVFTRGCRLVIIDEYGYAPSHVQAKKWYDAELRGDIDHGQKKVLAERQREASELESAESSGGLETFADLLNANPGSATYRELIQGLIEWIVKHGIRPAEFKRLNERGKYHVLTALLGELDRINKKAPTPVVQNIHLYANGKPLDQVRSGVGVLELTTGEQDVELSAEDSQYGEPDDGDEPHGEAESEPLLSKMSVLISKSEGENSDQQTENTPLVPITFINQHPSEGVQTEPEPPTITPELRTAANVGQSLDHTPGFPSDSDDLPMVDRPDHRLPRYLRRLS